MENWLSSLFLGELQDARRFQLEALPDLEARLASMVDAGLAAFPGVSLEPATFMFKELETPTSGT